MEQDPLQNQKQRVHRAALASQFEDSDTGKLIIGWLNAEVMKLTRQLAEDDELDTDNVKRAGVRGQLKAYRLIGEKLTVTKTLGVQAKNTLEENDSDPSAINLESMAENAGL